MLIVTMYEITIVEDDKAIREMYRHKLQAEGYSVSVAEDGKIAKAVLEEVKPDLVLLDIKMPKLPGNEVLRWLRGTSWGANTKVIVLTNVSKSEASSDFRVLSVSQYIVKAHFTPSQVMQIIKDVLS